MIFQLVSESIWVSRVSTDLYVVYAFNSFFVAFYGSIGHIMATMALKTQFQNIAFFNHWRIIFSQTHARVAGSRHFGHFSAKNTLFYFHGHFFLNSSGLIFNLPVVLWHNCSTIFDCNILWQPLKFSYWPYQQSDGSWTLGLTGVPFSDDGLSVTTIVFSTD